jgi:hypothetical protein
MFRNSGLTSKDSPRGPDASWVLSQSRVGETGPSRQIPIAHQLSVPRIDENDAKVFKMTGVAGRDGCFARSGDTRDMDVADLNRPADLPLPGSDYGRRFRRGPIERQHPAAEDLVDSRSKAPHRRSRRGRQAEVDL